AAAERNPSGSAELPGHLPKPAAGQGVDRHPAAERGRLRKHVWRDQTRSADDVAWAGALNGVGVARHTLSTTIEARTSFRGVLSCGVGTAPAAPAFALLLGLGRILRTRGPRFASDWNPGSAFNSLQCAPAPGDGVSGCVVEDCGLLPRSDPYGDAAARSIFSA